MSGYDGEAWAEHHDNHLRGAHTALMAWMMGPGPREGSEAV
jgi:hypothetical protein